MFLSVTGLQPRYALTLHVPAIIHSWSPDTIPMATEHASTSNMPVTTRVPALRPVCAAAFFVTVPQTSAGWYRGGSFSYTSDIPRYSRILFSYCPVNRFMKLPPDWLQQSDTACPVMRYTRKSFMENTHRILW